MVQVFFQRNSVTMRTIHAVLIAIPLVFISCSACNDDDKKMVEQKGAMEVAHGDPIYQSITRIAFMQKDSRATNSHNIHFSTLESYHKNPDGDKTVVYKYNIESGNLNSIHIPGSIEVRAQAFSRLTGKYVFGASLCPQIFLYNPLDQAVETVFSSSAGAWIHEIAVKDNFAYTILSTPSSPIPGFEGILKIDIQTKEWEVIHFKDRMEQNWGGVQSVDPTGRIWFWRGFGPSILKWYDAEHGIRERQISGYEGWTVKSWDVWGKDFYLILTTDESDMMKIQVDPITLEIKKNKPSSISEETKLFMSLMPVDLYHKDGELISSIYYSPKTFKWYKVDSEKMIINFLGHWDPGKYKVLGFTGSNLVVWKEGQKVYAIINFNTGDITINDINAPNISPADITSLVIGNDGYLYGGGYLTMSDMFKYNPVNNDVMLLKQAIPDGEGQVNSLFKGINGNIYGAGYPDSVIFKYDPALPWNPGHNPLSNPVNIGPMGHHNQMRAYRGIQDLDGNIWYQSVSDYSLPTAHALARVDFSAREVIVKTDLDDNFPIIKDLAIYDKTHILLLGEKGGSHKLFLLNQKDFVIEKDRELEREGGVLVNLAPQNPDANDLFLAQEDILYRVNNKNLSLQPVHKARGRIVKILRGQGNDIILLGQHHIEMIDNKSGDWEIWWNGSVFQHLSWIPAVFYNESLFIADEHKLKRFTPPEH